MAVIQPLSGGTGTPQPTGGGGIAPLQKTSAPILQRQVQKQTSQPKTTVVPQATQSQSQSFLQGAGKFIARTGVALADAASEAIDFTTSFISNNIDLITRTPQTRITQKLTGVDLQAGSKKAANKWKEFYNQKLKEDKVPTRELKEAVDQLQKVEYIQPSKEWNEAPLKVKLTTKLPETVLNIGPSLISSLGIYAINPLIGAGVTVTSTANDVKEQAIENYVDPDKAEKLGLVSGILVGALDRIVPDELFSGATKGRFLSNFVKRVATTSLKEAGTEIAQEDIQILAEATFRQDLGWDEIKTRNVMAGLGGLLGGAGAEVVVSTVNNTFNEVLTETDTEVAPQEEGAQIVTPDQAIAIALDEDIKPEQSQAIVKVAAQAKQTDQDIQIDVDEKGNVIAELVEKAKQGEIISQDNEQFDTKGETTQKPQKVFRGISKDDSSRGEVSVSTDRKVAESFGKRGIQEAYISPESKVLNAEDVYSGKLMKNHKVDSPDYSILKAQVEEYAQKNGYDAVDFSNVSSEKEIKILNKSILLPGDQADTGKITQELVTTAKTKKDVKNILSKARKEYTNMLAEAEGKAEVATAQREGLDTDAIAKLKRIYSQTKAFQEGDIETIRASKHQKLVNSVIENVQEVNPQMSEQEAFDFALGLPTKADTKVSSPELTALKKREKALSKYLATLDEKLKDLKVKESDALYKEWQSVVAQQQELAKVIGVPRSQLPVGEGKRKASRLEARVTNNLENLSPEIIEQLGLATYNQMSKKENIAAATAYVESNPEEAFKVITGEIEAPKGILRNSVYVAMENMAAGDVELARRLATLSNTRLGQELSILTEINPESPVKLMREIVQIREEAFKKRYKDKTVKQAKDETVNQIKKSIKVPDKKVWGDFLRSIEC